MCCTCACLFIVTVWVIFIVTIIIQYMVYLFLLFLFLLPDKLDGFKKRRRRGTGGDDEEEEEGEGLSLTEYLERKEAEYSKRGKPKKKRVSQLLIIIITINIGG